jgi:hypothetical protein
MFFDFASFRVWISGNCPEMEEKFAFEMGTVYIGDVAYFKIRSTILCSLCGCETGEKIVGF